MSYVFYEAIYIRSTIEVSYESHVLLARKDELEVCQLDFYNHACLGVSAATAAVLIVLVRSSPAERSTEYINRRREQTALSCA